MSNKLNHVKELIDKLQIIGYHTYQIKSIIKDTIESPLDNATDAELDLLISRKSVVKYKLTLPVDGSVIYLF